MNALLQNRLAVTVRLTVVMAAVMTMALLSAAAVAETPKLAVLQFELHDLTLTPGRADEVERTASVAGLLREQLAAYDIELIDIADAAQRDADAGHGYIYDRPRVAAELGEAAGADWIAVGRVHKPSDLFAYLIVSLVDVRAGREAREFKVEVKGTVKKITQRGAVRLAEKIAGFLRDGT